MDIPLPVIKLTQSSPWAVKYSPGVEFPFISQYLNVLFIAIRTVLSAGLVTSNPES